MRYFHVYRADQVCIYVRPLAWISSATTGRILIGSGVNIVP
jgi:hypothetical protein